MSTQAEKRPQREKYWEELNDKEKTERMHLVVKQLMRQVEELIDTNRKLMNHIHTPDGKMAVPFGNYGGNPLGSGAYYKSDRDKWF